MGKNVLIEKVNFKFLVIPGKWNPELISSDEITRATLIIGLEMLHFKETQLNGIVAVIDGRGFGLNQARQITPTIIKRYIGIILV